MSGTMSTERRPGRPRHTGKPRPAAPRDVILDHAAQLFTSRGFAGTSTRHIAEAVGIRQASLYFHFTNKGDILHELLEQTIRPTYDKVAKIEELADEHGWATVLYVLVLVDVHTLAIAPHNAGLLTRLPDVTSQPTYDRFITVRRELTEAYHRIGQRVGDSDRTQELRLGELLIQLVEVVISMRRTGADITATKRHAIATSALRICCVPEEQIWETAATAGELAQRHF